MNPPKGEEAEDAPTAQILERDPLEHSFEASAAVVLPAGSVLADRYRIVRFIAEGGMGAVYEAEDLQLRERVALKTVRPAIAGQAGALDRFKRETQLARRVTHPNVCRIFEFGLHRLANEGGEVAFLTMELLPGETLARRLRRVGRIEPSEALSLADQMAAGLTAAHEAGIIHRDFKSSNVILTPAAGGATRAVVSDFGLAQGPAIGDGPLDASGTALGTLDYMAPEQVEGGRATTAADLFAFGIVLYEMVTGVKPFTGSSPLSAAVKRLREAPPAPRSLVPELDPRWQAVILKCLQRDPKARFASPQDAVKALRPEGGPVRSPLTRQQRLAAIGVVVAVAAGAAYWLSRSAAPERNGEATDSAPVVPVKPRRAVAVLGFKNLSQQADAAWLSTALAEMFTTELAGGHGLRAIPGETVARSRLELSLPESDSLARDTLARVRGNLGVDIVVLGSYLAVGRGASLQVRLDVRAQDAASGEIVSSLSEAGTEAELLGLVSRAGARLRQALGVPTSPGDIGGARAALPSNPDAMRLYAEGLDRLHVFDARGAQAQLESAVRSEPGSALAHAALGEAWSLLGYEERAREEARLAFERSRELPREERLSVEGRYREAAREWDKAVEIYGVLYGFFPDNLEHGLRLAQAQTAAGKPDQAFETVASLHRLAAPASEDPRIDLAESAVAQSVGDFRRQRDAARRAATQGSARGARLLLARARLLEAYASGRLGLEAEAKAAADEARSVYVAAGDRGGLAWVLNRTGNVLFQQGRVTEARGLYGEALGIFEELGYRGGLASVTNNIAIALIEQGDLAGARRMVERAEAVYREAGDRRGSAIVASNLAGIRQELGDLSGARRAYDDALEECRRLGEKSLAAGVTQRKADSLAAAGDLVLAKAAYQEAATSLRELGLTRYAAVAIFGLAQVLREEGDARAARAAHEEALGSRRQIGDRLGVADSEAALARLSLEEGNAKEAEAAIRRALQVFVAEGVRDREAEGGALLARTIQGQGRHAEAGEVGRKASVLASKSQRPRVRLAVRIALAQVGAAPGRTAEAERDLHAAQMEAAQGGFLGLELETRLSLGELQLLAGRAEEARRGLQEVETEATRRGFGRLARLASQRSGAAAR